jgi:hypothetical protein
VEGKEWQSLGRLLPGSAGRPGRWRCGRCGAGAISWQHLRHTHLSLPLWLWVLAVGATLSTQPADRALLLGLPAMAMLAAFALPTLRQHGRADRLVHLLFFTISALPSG